MTDMSQICHRPQFQSQPTPNLKTNVTGIASKLDCCWLSYPPPHPRPLLSHLAPHYLKDFRGSTYALFATVFPFCVPLPLTPLQHCRCRSSPPALLLRACPQFLILMIAAAMPDKRMRPIVKQEPGADGAQQLQQQQEAAGESQREGRRRRGDMGEEGAGTELEVQLLRANAKAHAFALQGMERKRAMAAASKGARCGRRSGSKTRRSRPPMLLCRARTL